MLGLTCRVGEGFLNVFPVTTLGLIWLATRTPDATDATDATSLANLLMRIGTWKYTVGATLFAVGSTAFSYLLLRGRLIPRWMAWLGVAASILLVVLLPLQLAGLLHGAIVTLMWVPMAAFEIPLGFWLIFKGVADFRPIEVRTSER